MERENVLNLLGEYSSVRVVVINNNDIDYKFVIDIVWFEDFDNEIVIFGDNNSHIVFPSTYLQLYCIMIFEYVKSINKNVILI